MTFRRLALTPLIAGSPWALAQAALPPRYDHVVVVVEENHSRSGVIGNAAAPYLNQLAAEGTSFDAMHGLTHPSQPNYLELFSGSGQGWTDDGVPTTPQGTPTTTAPYASPNFAAALRAAGYSFAGYAQGLPAVGSQAVTSGDYVRRHVPWANWQDGSWADDAHRPAAGPLPNALPKSVNLPFASFPGPGAFASLPTVAVVVPDLQHDMHNGTVAQADAWLRASVDPYYQWARAHNSLLIVTWDEDDASAGGDNRVPTIFAGAGVRAGGVVAQPYTHHDTLRTLEDMYGLPHAGAAARVRPIVGAFAGDPAVTRVTFAQGVGGYAGTRDTQVREAAPTTAYGASATLSADADDDAGAAGNQHAQALLRFDNLIAGGAGGGGGTIPADATILSAKLAVHTTNPTATPVELHRMVAPWSDATATWRGLGGGVAADGVRAAAAADFVGAPPLAGTAFYFDVSDAVQAWVDGTAANNGWAILPTGTDGFAMVSSEGAAAAQRPTLDVTYALYPRFAAVPTAAAASWGGAAGTWAHGTPDGPGAVARLPARPGATAVTLDGPRTVGTLLIDSPAGAYTVSAGTGGTLTFANRGNVATLDVRRGSHALAVPITFADPGRVDVGAGATLAATAGVGVSAGATLTKAGAGSVGVTGGLVLGAGAVADVGAGELDVDRVTGAGGLAVRAGAKVRLTAAGGAAGVVTRLTLDGAPGAWTGTLDVGRGGLVVDYAGTTASPSPIAALVDQVRFGRAGGWSGPGIGSSAAAAGASGAAVAVGEASAVLGLAPGGSGTFMGQPVDATGVLIRYTLAGDATMDGVVDFRDLVRLAQNYNAAAAGPGAWDRGDFDYDGRVDFNDLVRLAQNYNATVSGGAIPGSAGGFEADRAAAFAGVPEPSAAVAAVTAGALGVLGGRRRPPERRPSARSHR